MLTAAQRREVVRAIAPRGLSERRALAIVRMSPSSLWYVPAPDQNASLFLADRTPRSGAGPVILHGYLVVDEPTGPLHVGRASVK